MPTNIQCSVCNKRAAEGRDIFSCGHPVCLDCYIGFVMSGGALFAKCRQAGCKDKESTYDRLKRMATPTTQKTVRQIDFKTAGRLLFGMTNSAQICGKFVQLGYEFTQKMLEPKSILPWVKKLDKGVMVVSLVFLMVFGLIFGRYYVEDNREFCLHVLNNIKPDFGDPKKIPPKRALLLLLISVVCALIGISNLNYAFHLPAQKYILPDFIRYICLFPFAVYSIGLFAFSIGHLGTVAMEQKGGAGWMKKPGKAAKAGKPGFPQKQKAAPKFQQQHEEYPMENSGDEFDDDGSPQKSKQF